MTNKKLMKNNKIVSISFEQKNYKKNKHTPSITQESHIENLTYEVIIIKQEEILRFESLYIS